MKQHSHALLFFYRIVSGNVAVRLWIAYTQFSRRRVSRFSKLTPVCFLLFGTIETDCPRFVVIVTVTNQGPSSGGEK